MSNELFALALKCDIESTAQITVMMVLADAADDEGVCWPSVEHLIATTRLGRSTVLRVLSELEQEGYITKQRRRARSSVYTLVRERLARVGSHSETSRSETSQNGTLGTLKVPERDFLRSQSGTVLKGTPTRTPNTSAKRADDEHPEASKLCDRLAELMVANGCKHPTIGKRWLDAARLLLTRDRRPFQEVLAVLEWTQADDFESANVHSMPKLRARYDQLRLKAQKAGALAAKRIAPTTAEGAVEWLRAQWQDASVVAIERATGLRYEKPDLPLDVDLDGVDEFYRQHRRDWITEHHGEIVARLTARGAA